MSFEYRMQLVDRIFGATADHASNNRSLTSTESLSYKSVAPGLQPRVTHEYGVDRNDQHSQRAKRSSLTAEDNTALTPNTQSDSISENAYGSKSKHTSVPDEVDQAHFSTLNSPSATTARTEDTIKNLPNLSGLTLDRSDGGRESITCGPNTVSKLDDINFRVAEKCIPPISLTKGELAPQGMAFIPVATLAKFPYKLVRKDRMEEVAKIFFNGGRFWEREFDLFYTWSISKWAPKALIVIPFAQFHELILQINCACEGLNLDINDEHYRKIGLIMAFDGDQFQLRPRFLGRSASKHDYEQLCGLQLPNAEFRPAGEDLSVSIDDDVIRQHNRMIDMALSLKSNKRTIRSTASASSQPFQNEKSEYAVSKQIRRLQSYLGMCGEQTDDCVEIAPSIDVAKPPRFPKWKHIVLICLDVEAYERNHNLITEIGITTLDTRDIQTIAPGRHGENWAKQMRSRHLRVQEHLHLRNSEFISGCPERFDFGKSEVVRLQDLPRVIASCFKAPFSASVEEQTHAETGDNDTEEKRNIVFVGHNPLADIQYLQKLGYDPYNLPNLLETVDTAQLWRVMSKSKDTTSLGTLLYHFDIVGWNLHNAGNDAAYTMQALIALIIRSAPEGSAGLKDAQAVQ